MCHMHIQTHFQGITFVTLCTQEFLFNSFIMSSVNMTPYIFSPNQQQAKMDFKKLK